MMDMQSNSKWEEMFQRALEYRFENGNWSVPISYPADPELGRWVAEQRIVRTQVMRGVIQSTSATWKQRQEKLNQVGFDWDDPSQPMASSQNDARKSASMGSCRPASPVSTKTNATTTSRIFHLHHHLPFFHEQHKNSSFFAPTADAEPQRLMGVENALARLNSKYFETHNTLLPTQANLKKKNTGVPPVSSSSSSSDDSCSSCNSCTEDVSGEDEGKTSQSKGLKKKVVMVKPKGKFADKMNMLPEDFVPADGDVICGKGKKFFNHSGNKNFRQMVANKVQEYSSTSKLQRSFIVSEIVAAICHGSNNSTGFVKKDSSSGRWFQLGDASARLKATYAFWDALQELEQQQQQKKNSSSSDTIDKQSTKTPEKTASQTLSSSSSSSVQTSKSSQELPLDFRPSQHDVIIENGNKNYNHSGNKYFRSLIADKVQAYAGTRSKVEKSFIVSSIVAEVRAKSAAAAAASTTSGCGGFVKKTPEGRWMEIGDFLAREKTSQALRNAVGSYRSSSTTKKKRRIESLNNCLTSGQCDEINERLKPSKMPRTSVNFPNSSGLAFLSIRP